MERRDFFLGEYFFTVCNAEVLETFLKPKSVRAVSFYEIEIILTNKKIL